VEIAPPTNQTEQAVSQAAVQTIAARRRKRFVRLTAAALLITLIGLPILLTTVPSALYMWATTHPPCSNSDNITLAAYNLPFSAINIPSRDGVIYRGFFVPGSLNATIIFPPTYSSGRSEGLRQMAIMAKHGYNIVNFESRVCTRKGMISLGYREVDDVGDVLAYLKQNPDHLPLKLDHIGIYGFSSAGATATMAAARYPELAALISEGGYHNTDELYGLGEPSGFLQAITFAEMQLAYRIDTGEDPANLSPINAIPKIVPRPILFIYGALEQSLPGARLQLAAARAADPNTSAELWVVHDANHGGYLRIVGDEEYARHVLPFLDCSLLAAHCDEYHALWNTPAPFF